jgi:hypothetical protein
VNSIFWQRKKIRFARSTINHLDRGSLDRLSNILKQRLHEAQTAQAEHPPTDTLLEFVERSLAAPRRENVLAHLAICPTCREAVALAIPEANESTPSAARAQNRGFYLPMGMRWASLAAALAVAVGVGLISYEHQSQRMQSGDKNPALQDVLAEKHPPSANSSRENAVSHTAAGAKTMHQTKSTNLLQHVEEKDASDRGKERNPTPAAEVSSAGSVIDGMSATRNSAALDKKSESRAANLRVGERSMTQPETPQNGFLTQAAPATLPPAALGITSPSSNQMPSSNLATNRDLRGTAMPALTSDQKAPGSATESVTVETTAAPPTTDAYTVDTIPGITPKAIHSAAVAGPSLRAKSAYRFNGIVRWAISQAGKLERHAQDGVATIIEPAAGVTFRALAAAGTGIEVWAGGLQPDLSAKEWRQQPVLFHSSDAGETWTKVNGPWHGAISQLRLADAGSVVVMAEDGTWKTTDAGRNWQKQ